MINCWWHMLGGRERVISAADAVNVHIILDFSFWSWEYSVLFWLYGASLSIPGWGMFTKDVIFPSNRVGRSKRHYIQPLQQPSHYPGQRLVLRLKCIQSSRRQT